MNFDGTVPQIKRPQIKNVIMMGDSLSDRGTIKKTMLLGCLPMAKFSGLEGRSPDGRFTNGLAWSDHVSAKIASDFTIRRLQKKWHLDDTDVSDAIIARERKVVDAIRGDYTLDNDKFVNYHGKLWVRSYCVGGVMAHDYGWNLTTNPIRFVTRIILSSLKDLRDKLNSYDRQHDISYKQKAETLVIEWSGPNDLVTVNEKPTLDGVDKAVAARIENARKLIGKGYRHIILMNLPNLGLTPRFQNKNQHDRNEAQECSEYFNAQLKIACDELTKDYPHCLVQAFDINAMFETIYHNPERYLFDQDKLTVPYMTSQDFDDPSDGISKATGYMFYDDIHPSADMHALLASHFYDQLNSIYELLEPDNKHCNIRKNNVSESELLHSFRKRYQGQLVKDQHGFFGSKSDKFNYKDADLEIILKHAFDEGGARALKVVTKLGWFDEEGTLVLQVPALKSALEHVHPGATTRNNPLGSLVL